MGASATDSNRELFDSYYDKPDWWFRFRYDTQVKRRSCLALLRRSKTPLNGRRVLEIGFGSGQTLFSLPKTCAVFGLEISRTAVRRAREQAPQRGFATCDFWIDEGRERLPLPDSDLDLVIASHVLEHVPNDRHTLAECQRVLKPRGRLLVVVPVNERYPDDCHVRSYTFATCQSACEAAGFTYLQGFENELLFYLVEWMYMERTTPGWSGFENIVRVAFNFGTSPLPFWTLRLFDRIMATITGLPPRQACLIFERGPDPRSTGA